MGLGCKGGSGSALQRDRVLGARGCLPSLLLLAPCCAYLFLPSFTREPTCVLAEAHRHSYLLDLLLQKTHCFLFALLLQPVTFQGSRLVYPVSMDNTPPGTVLWPDAGETISKTAGAEMNARMSAKCFLRVHHVSSHRVNPVLGLLGTAAPSLRWGLNLCLTGVAEPALQC